MKNKTKERLEDIIKRVPYYYVNTDLNTKNFPIPDKIEIEGWKLIKMSKNFCGEEALYEIKKQGCRPANAYELALWSEKHREEINRSKSVSVLALDQTPLIDRSHRVPGVDRYSDGDFGFYLDDWEGDWRGSCVLLAFCDSSLDTRKLKVESLDSLTPEFDPIDVLHIKYRDEHTGIQCIDYGDKVTIETSGGEGSFFFKNSSKETVKKVCESILRLIAQK